MQVSMKKLRSVIFQVGLIAIISVPISSLLFVHDEGALPDGSLKLVVDSVSVALAYLFMPGIFAAFFLTMCGCLEAYPYHVYYLGVSIELLIIWAIVRYWSRAADILKLIE